MLWYVMLWYCKNYLKTLTITDGTIAYSLVIPALDTPGKEEVIHCNLD
jgi:hypothetical protein